jgi:DNA mismatch endonuclease (patch repair protein)
MSRIKNGNTRPEMLVRRYLHAHGFRYRLHAKDLPGTPDIVLPRLHTVVMVHGCFWHGHEGCRYYVVPKTRTDWWLNKIKNNKAHDAATETALQAAGWRVITLWGCALKPTAIQATLTGLVQTLQDIRNSTKLTQT